ncbi:esterase/lipase superfamily enzyme [Bradyrhizobium sp. F1.13.4]
MWSRCRRLDWAVAVLFSLVLVSCAARPGPEVLTPVAASSGEKALQIYVATTRERETSSGNVFTANRASVLNFAKFVVSVPPTHKSGNVEMPTATPDPRSSFAVVAQSVMSEAEFRKAVAPQGDTRRKKHKAFVFVHGFKQQLPRVAVPARSIAGGHPNRRDSDPVLLAIARSDSCL